MIGVIAKIPVKEGKVEEVIALLKEMVAHVAKEEGTLAYSLNRDPANPDTIVIMERYRDKAALDAHSSTPHFKELFSKMPAFLGGKPEIAILEEIASI
ncbi:MAG: antibiotic biosynthesis monooxygenase [Deltaproteobacteria bacterium]|nr:antibiotic biosynthesis monooxygenase [Deltaproteobacteria bacterium]